MAGNNRYSDVYICFDIETSKIRLSDGTDFQIEYLVCSQLINGNTHEIIEELFFRDIKEFIDYLYSYSITDKIDLKKKQRILVFAHNLDYELTFINRELKSNMLLSSDELDDWGEPRSLSTYRDNHAPLSIILEKLPHVEFRCTYALSNKSLKQIGKDLGIEKLDYEYETIRLPHHELTSEDYEYNKRDVDITRRYIQHVCEDLGYTLENIRLSKTSMVVDGRIKHTENYYPELTKDKKNNNQRRKCTNKFLYHAHDYKFYMLQTKSYYGGTATCNPSFTNKLIRKLYSVDIKSSYPHIICCCRIPNYDISCTQLFIDNANDYFQKHLNGLNHQTLSQYGNQNTDNVKGYYGTFTFINLRVKEINGKQVIPTLSFSKSAIGCEGFSVFNGKVISAKQITFSFNNVGLDCLNLIYDYDEIICEELTTTTKLSFLPMNEITYVLECFGLKETLPKDTLEYRLAKENANSQYGLKVQKMIKNKFNLKDGILSVIDYYTKDLSEEIKEEVFNRHMKNVRDNYGLGSRSGNKNLMKRWDVFSDGTYITDLARYQLLDMVVKLTELGFDVVYTDTDSVKFTIEEWQNEEPTEEEVQDITNFLTHYFEEYNDEIIQYNQELVQFQQIKEWLNLDNKTFTKICKLGVFEIESGYDTEDGFVISPYPYFKTLGAKKYACIEEDETGKQTVKTTISGCNKINLPEVIKNHSERYGFYLHESLNECFSAGTMYEPRVSGRTRSVYEQREHDDLPSFYYEQQLINGTVYEDKEVIYPLTQKGGVVIIPCEYTLNISKNDCDYLGLEYKKIPHQVLTFDGELRTLTEEEKRKYLINEEKES